MKLWNVETGVPMATFYAIGSDWAAVAADGRYVTNGDIRKFISLFRDGKELPMDDFITLDHRDSLAEVLSATAQ